MKAEELRRSYVTFFEERGHKEIASASVLPDNDPSVLFTTAGMHPLVPYLLGEKHPLGHRLVGTQKCVRTCDIDEVGDSSHLTFFEMLGNWSLGDYFKEESIKMSFEFLTKVLGISKDRLAVTVFEGDELVPRDTYSYELWKQQGLNDTQIYYYGREENWWGPAGQTGPCGPDTEIFYDTGKNKCCFDCGPSCHCGKFVEIWNNVFMEYNKNADQTYSELKQKNIDTGMGMERVMMILDSKNSVYETELFEPIMKTLETLTGRNAVDNIREFRIVSDHIRAAVFILGDPKVVVPSNTEQGYILRRIIRRSIRIIKKLGVSSNILTEIAEKIITMYQTTYPELRDNHDFVLNQLSKEYIMFSKTLDYGLKKAEKYFKQMSQGEELSGSLAFHLYDTYGFPIELTEEFALEQGFRVDLDGFHQKFEEHQAKSRTGAEGKFKGGLADNSEQTTKLHTATHLLNGALRKVLGNNIYQRGSNINTQRLRFDFSFDRKLTEEEINEVSRIVNEAIDRQINVICEEMTIEEAKEVEAIGVFDNKYGEIVKVYTVEGYSKEICGGPHAANTKELGRFHILKEESSSTGVRRIKAELI